VGYWGGVQHWDGATWKEVPFEVQGHITAVHGIAFNAPASGWVIYGGTYRWNMFHYDGREWELWKTKDTAPGFYDIHFQSEDNGWAVGQYGFMGNPPMAGWHWDGHGWSAYPCPPVFTPRSVWTISENEVWAGGEKGRFAYLRY
jgi:hypothetical protein